MRVDRQRETRRSHAPATPQSPRTKLGAGASASRTNAGHRAAAPAQYPTRPTCVPTGTSTDSGGRAGRTRRSPRIRPTRTRCRTPAATRLRAARSASTISSGIGSVRVLALDLGVPDMISPPMASRFSAILTVLAFRSTFVQRNPAISSRRSPWSDQAGDGFALVAQIVGLQLQPSNIHHADVLAKFAAFSARLVADHDGLNLRFLKMPFDASRKAQETHADGGSRFEHFVSAEVPYFSRTFLTLQGLDPSSGSDVWHLLLAVLVSTAPNFPA